MIWPETTKPALDAAQNAYDSGRDRWRGNAVATARRFAERVMGWEPSDTVSRVRVVPGGSNDVSVVELSNRSLLKQTSPSYRQRFAETVTLVRIGQRGEAGIWSVASVRTAVIHIICPANPVLTVTPSTYVCGTLSQPGASVSPNVRVDLFPADGRAGDLTPGDGIGAVASTQGNQPRHRVAFDASLGRLSRDFGPGGIVTVRVLDGSGEAVFMSASPVLTVAFRRTGLSLHNAVVPLQGKRYWVVYVAVAREPHSRPISDAKRLLHSRRIPFFVGDSACDRGAPRRFSSLARVAVYFEDQAAAKAFADRLPTRPRFIGLVTAGCLD